ncbi:hypothetical protein QR66_16400, partial [Chromobacterium piscinae]
MNNRGKALFIMAGLCVLAALATAFVSPWLGWLLASASGLALLAFHPLAPTAANESAAQAIHIQTTTPGDDSLELLEQVLQRWAGNLQLVIEQSASGGNQLAGTLTAIANGLHATIEAARSSSDDIGSDSLDQMVRDAGLRSQEISAVLSEIIGHRQQLVEEVSRLATFSSELLGMADQVGRISNQTNLLALNASIEAARAG